MPNKQLTTINPLTEEVVATYSYMSDAEAAAAVKASHDAFLQWRLRSLDERARWFRTSPRRFVSARKNLHS